MDWPLPNVWLGVSAEDQAAAEERVPLLLGTPAAVRFLSAEPLLGPIDLRAVHLPRICSDRAGSCDPISCRGVPGVPTLDWVIVGGESGSGARPMDIGWARSLVEQCRSSGVAVFVKQLGAWPRAPRPRDGVLCGLPLRDRKGGDPAEWPEDLRVREMPRA